MVPLPFMKCGCQSNAQDAKGNPVCAVHIGLVAGATVVDTSPPDLKGRTAKCGCGRKEDSVKSLAGSLAFFEHQPEREFDSFYCGCRGWD